MTGKNKIRLTLVFVVSISFGVSLLSMGYMNRMVKRLASIAAVDARMTEISESLSIKMLEARQAEKNYIIFYDSTYINLNTQLIDNILADVSNARQISPLYKTQLDSVEKLVNLYRENIHKLTETFQEDPRMLTRIGQQVMQTERELRRLNRSQKLGQDDWMTDLNITLLAASNKLSSDKVRIFENLKLTSNRVIALTQKISRTARASLSANTDQAIHFGARAQRNILTLLLLSFLILGILIYYLPKRIFEPLKGILRALKAVGRGDVDFPMPSLESKDEIGEISRSFCEATRKIRYFNELITDKIVEVKRNQQRILEEIEEGVIIATPDYKITYMNQATRELFKLKGEVASLKDLQVFWKSLQPQLEQLDQQGRRTFELKMNPRSLRKLEVSVIPRPGKMGKIETILIIIR
jgi:PAS domain-containing protein